MKIVTDKAVREMNTRVDERAGTESPRTWVDTRSVQSALANVDTMYGKLVDEILSELGMKMPAWRASKNETGGRDA
jgi:hypothetical protein